MRVTITMEMLKKLAPVSQERLNELQQIAEEYMLPKKEIDIWQRWDKYEKNSDFSFPEFSGNKEAALFVYIVLIRWNAGLCGFFNLPNMYHDYYGYGFWVPSELDLLEDAHATQPENPKPGCPPKQPIMERLFGKNWFELPFVSYERWPEERRHATFVNMDKLLEFIIQ